MIATAQAILTARGQCDEIVDLVRQAAERGEPIDLVERDLMHNPLAPGHRPPAAYVARQGDGDGRPESATAEGTPIRRPPETQDRRYVAISGELTIRRVVDGSRQGPRIERAPPDERPGRPEGDSSSATCRRAGPGGSA
jgi:hypothetical protein